MNPIVVYNGQQLAIGDILYVDEIYFIKHERSDYPINRGKGALQLYYHCNCFCPFCIFFTVQRVKHDDAGGITPFIPTEVIEHIRIEHPEIVSIRDVVFTDGVLKIYLTRSLRIIGGESVGG